MPDGNYLCKSLQKIYYVKNGIVLMGYCVDKKAEVLQALNESKEHQVTKETANKEAYYHSAYSFPMIFQSITTYKTLYNNFNGIALNVGSGGDPSSNLIAELGFETYALELDPNVLFLQSLWDDILNTNVNRIACDAFFLPFPDNSVDLIYCKEFLHHIELYDKMISEFHRVLSEKGVLIIIEPTLTHRTTKQALNFPGHFYAKNTSYIKSFKKNGFEIDEYYLSYQIRKNSFKQKVGTAIYKFHNYQFRQSFKSCIGFNKYWQKVLDGQNLWYLSKRIVSIDSARILCEIESIHQNYFTIDYDHLVNLKRNEYIKKTINYFLSLYNNSKIFS